MAPTYTTTSLGIRWLPGSNLASDIDAGFSALATDVDALIVARDVFLGVSSGGSVRSGKSIIATSESRTNVAYGLMTTPDRVQNIVLATDGLIMVGYQALWANSVLNSAQAALFLGSNQVQSRSNSTAPVPQEVLHQNGVAGRFSPLSTSARGLATHVGNNDQTSDVTTGQIIGTQNIGAGNSTDFEGGGVLYMFAAAGTYDVSVQFKASSGSVTVKERKLWVRAMTFA